MAKLSDSRPTNSVTLSGGCVVQVYTSFTVANMRSLQATYGANLQSIPTEKQADFSIDACLSLIKTWDMTDDDDTAVLPTPDVLAKLPQPDLKAILDVAVPKAGGDQQTSESSN